MATTHMSTSSASPSAQVKYLGWRVSEITEKKVNELVVQEFKKIVGSYSIRSQSNKIEGGPWYGSDYYKKLIAEGKKDSDHFKALHQESRFYLGFPPKGFKHLANPIRREFYHYKLIPGRCPTEALEDACGGRVSFIDCAMALQLAVYNTLRQILGDDKFNIAFRGSGQSALDLQPGLGRTILYGTQIIKPVEGDPRPGDLVYFSGVPTYNDKHPYGVSGAYHTMCISADGGGARYIAFGTSPEGLTQEDLCNLMVEEYNKEPIRPEDYIGHSFRYKFESHGIDNQPKSVGRVYEEGAHYRINCPMIREIVGNFEKIRGM